uniref:glycosyltransferase family 4 protein n=1 Tax=Bacteroides uniformis TaxID=820 RepID=UPI004026EE48
MVKIRNLRIKFLSFALDEYDRRMWSGTVFMEYQSLKEASADIHFVSCAPKVPYWHKAICWSFRMLNRLHLTKKQFAYSNSYLYRTVVAKQLATINFNDCDAILVVAHSVIVSALPPMSTPIVYMTDAPYSGIENYYPEVSNLYSFSSRQANAISKNAWERSKLVITSSDWAKQHAIDDYGIAGDKIKVVEFGANLRSPHLGKCIKDYCSKAKLNILLSGVNWQRKGGDIAVACCQALQEKGLDVTLFIVGMEVPSEYRHLAFIKPIGFLNKNIPAQYNKYVELLLDTDIFLFPTRAECSAIVTCEAAAFGIPIFTYDTGGLGNYVVNGVNGYRLSMDSTGVDFANCIYSSYIKSELEKLSSGATMLFNAKLNWEIWADKVLTYICTIVDK